MNTDPYMQQAAFCNLVHIRSRSLRSQFPRPFHIVRTKIYRISRLDRLSQWAPNALKRVGMDGSPAYHGSGFLVSYSMKLLQSPGGNAIKTPDIIKPAKEQPRCRGRHPDLELQFKSGSPIQKKGPAKAEPRFWGKDTDKIELVKNYFSFYNGILSFL